MKRTISYFKLIQANYSYFHRKFVSYIFWRITVIIKRTFNEMRWEDKIYANKTSEIFICYEYAMIEFIELKAVQRHWKRIEYHYNSFSGNFNESHDLV